MTVRFDTIKDICVFLSIYFSLDFRLIYAHSVVRILNIHIVFSFTDIKENSQLIQNQYIVEEDRNMYTKFAIIKVVSFLIVFHFRGFRDWRFYRYRITIVI